MTGTNGNGNGGIATYIEMQKRYIANLGQQRNAASLLGDVPRVNMLDGYILKAEQDLKRLELAAELPV